VPLVIQVLKGEKPANSARIYPDTVPGSIYRYSGGGYTVMQKMLTDISGMDFPELMEKYVLSEIGMTNSTYEQALPEELKNNAASGHRPDGKMVEGRWHTYPEMAAAGLWTTPSDLLMYALEVQNSLKGESNRIISQGMTEEMLTPQMDSHGLGPGLGGEGDSLTFGHGGANEGYRCQLFAFARFGQGVAIMTNSDNGGQLMSEILRSFSDVYSWSTYKPLKKEVLDADEIDLKKFVGLYTFPWQDQEMVLEITAADDHLFCVQQWDGIDFRIYPESELLFFNMDDGAPFEFKKGESGEISEIIIQNYYNFKKK
jgi:hypothetical protein